jgi:hypothetical protein
MPRAAAENPAEPTAIALSGAVPGPLDALTRAQARVAAAALGALALACVYAAVEWRSLSADGFYYFMRMLEKEGFEIAWVPQRRALEVLHELPTVVAMALGLRDVGALALIYGLTVQLAPLALTALCYPVLPRERKLLFLFPLLHYVACTTGAAFMGIHAGPTGAAYFWLVFHLVLFARPRPWSLGLVVLAALPAPAMHESMLFLGPILAAAGIWRAMRGRARRGVFALLAGWFFAAALYQVVGVVAPADTANRDNFLQGLPRGWWLFAEDAINLPIALGIAALLMLALYAMVDRARERARRGGVILVAGFAAAAAVALAVVIALDLAPAQGQQFAARNHAALASFPLALAALWALWRPGWPSPPRVRLALGLAAVLAAAAVVYDAHVTRRWSAYLADYRGLLREQRGLVGWERALAALPPERRRDMARMTWPWVSTTMSLVLAPGGKVTAIIANPPQNAGRWQPFDPRVPEQIPRSRFWDLEPYLRALAAQKAAGEVR